MDKNFGIEKNEVIVITGASGTMGKALIVKLLAGGIKVIAQSRVLDKLNDLPKSPNLIKLVYDISNKETAKDFLPSIAKEHGKIKGLVMLAGFDKLMPIQLTSAASLQELLDVHAVVPYLLVGSLAKRDIASENASVVLMSSLSTKGGAAGHTAYAMAKGALGGFLMAAASELAPKKIRVNLLTPGVVQGEMSNAWINKLTDTQKEALLSSYPLGLGTGEDIANSAYFLLSKESKWITGQEIILDGGHLCRRT